MKTQPYQPKTGQKCHCKPGIHRDNCPDCEGTGWRIDFAAIRARNTLPAFKVTRDDGSSYVTSMAQGVTLETATAYFLGAVQVDEDFETGKETRITVTKVERV